MKVGVIILNFGEPAEPTPEAVIPFLERIFMTNAGLEHGPDPEARRRRSRELAEQRAPGLIAEYEEIGGSPLNAQAEAQRIALEVELRRRGIDATVYSGFQFTEPLIAEVVEEARQDGVDRLIGLPIYPLCGRSTNVAALDDIQAALEASGWEVPFRGLTGWHRHPLYLELRVDAIRQAVAAAGTSLSDPDTTLLFSAHGTPIKYVEEGSRYVEYVEEFCSEVADLLGVQEYELGYQNHTNRRIAWTQPDVGAVIPRIRGARVVVDAVSFMHEQSETLAELDHELREEAEEAGLEFIRVPVPHDDPRFAQLLADLVEPLLTDSESPLGLRFGPCRCRPAAGALCLNSRPRAEAAPPPKGSAS